MFRPLAPSHRRPDRRGTSILLVALIMLTLFSAVGTAYVFYALREAKLAQARKEEQGAGTPPLLTAPDPTSTINAFFNALIYDVSGNGNDLVNGLRGHSIARSMYGYDASATLPITTPWAGVGLFHENPSSYGTTFGTLPGDRAQLVNYTLMMLNSSPFLLDPEYTGIRPITSGTLQPFSTNNRTYVGKHAGYSYPDLKDFFAASLDPVTGQVLVPSFHRPWLFGGLDQSNGGATSNNWKNSQGRLLTLRPRPAEHPNFPYVPPNADNTYTGDVQNMPGGVGVQKNDSLWMNLGLPVITLPNGQRVQPLVAPLIVPMDGLFNVSAHGNTFFSNSHGSYAGYGPWEVNMGVTNSQGVPALSSADMQTIVGARGTPKQRSGATARAYAPYSTGPLPSYAPVAWDQTPVAKPLAYPTYNPSQINVMLGLPAFSTPVASGTAPSAPAPYQNSNAAVTNHPSLFNPNEWSSSSSQPRTFATSDIRRLQRYASTPNWYSQMSLQMWTTPTSIASIEGTPGTYGYTYNTQQATPANYNYRLDPAHATRGLFTTHAFDLDRPKLVPNFPYLSASTAGLVYNTSTNKAGKVSPGQYPSSSTISSNNQNNGANSISDFTASNRLSNALAALGSVDLNRPLTDYRSNTSQPLSSSNMATGTNLQNAINDRQQLAKDIFVRLVAALGAGATVQASNGTYTILAASGSSQYQALGYLAQLAVNIVDYIDNDDISTSFTWDPKATPPQGVVYGVEKPRLVINEAYGEITNDPTDPINSNTMPPTGPTQPVQARFWVELLNPTATLNPSNGAIGDGTVQLNAYQILIRRETRTIVTTMANQDTGQIGNNQAPNLYSTPSNTMGNFLSTSGTAGTADATFSLANQQTVTAVSPSNGAYAPTTANPPPNGTVNGIVLIGPPPANPQKTGSDEFFPPTTGAWANMITSNPLTQETQSKGMGYQFPLQADAAYSNAEFKRHIILLQRLANPYAPSSASNPYITVDMMDYVPAFDAVCRGKNDLADRNPWSTTNMNGYDPVNNMTQTGNNRFSVGKVQPYAGHAMITNQTNGVSNGNPVPRSTAMGTTLANGSYNMYTFSNPTPSLVSMVLPQTLSNFVSGQPQHTFGSQNSKNGPTGTAPTGQTFNKGTGGTPASLSDNLMTPFDWYVHMDRPLVNPIELFEVRDTPAYRVTDQFILGATPSATNPGITYTAGIGRWRYTYDGLARALEFLTVKPYTVGVPHGGRVPGRINLNVLQDQRVFNGLFDPQGGNGFDLNSFVNSGGTGNGSAWNGWMATREASGVTTRLRADGTTAMSTTGSPGESIFDLSPTASSSTNASRPFLSFGAPAADPSGSFAYSAVGYSSPGHVSAASPAPPIDMTILRADGNPFPYLYTNSTSKASGLNYPSSHPNGPGYMQTEAVRKILNNTTTVSHTYLVYLTIGYFTLDPNQTAAPNNWPGGVTYPATLGAEAFLSVPGDMRQKVVAVVDMSNMAVDASTVQSPPQGGPQQASARPFFTSLEATAYAPSNPTPTQQVTLTVPGIDSSGNAYADGVAVPIQGTTLALGYGSEQQIVTVQSVQSVPSVPPGGSNVTTISVTGLTRTAWAGTCVSNVVPGYSGPQSKFNYLSTQYQSVLPYIERLR